MDKRDTIVLGKDGLYYISGRGLWYSIYDTVNDNDKMERKSADIAVVILDGYGDGKDVKLVGMLFGYSCILQEYTRHQSPRPQVMDDFTAYLNDMTMDFENSNRDFVSGLMFDIPDLIPEVEREVRS